VKIISDNDLKAVCSVGELAKKLNLSRARFYQLQKTGVFPMPAYCIRTRRPIYTLDLQQKCIAVRKTGIGYNGQPILFNAMRKNKFGESQSRSDNKYEELMRCLKEMGLNVPLDKVKAAVKNLYPQGLPQHQDKGRVIKELYRNLE
jgi:hypothetical protein